MPSIKFYATEPAASSPGGTLINHGANSGIGFYGAGYGVSVPIGGRQDTTWVTNEDGTSSERVQLSNTKYMSSSTVSIDGAAAIDLENLPNVKCPLNIRFTHDEAVRVQNCKARIFDRNDITKQASGVTTYVYEARHPSTDQAKADLDHKGRSANTWYEYDPVDAMSDMTFTSSPGMSGTNTNTNDTDPTLGYVVQGGASHASTRHDWYAAISCEPDSIGSKTQYALYFSAEYL